MTTHGNRAASWPRSVLGALVALAVLGAVAFAVGVTGRSALRAWQIYLVNYLFWSGIAVAGVVLAAIWHVSNSGWGKAFQGVAVAGAGVFPAVLVLFLPLPAAGGELFPWIEGTEAYRAAWMQPTFVFLRNGLGLLALLALASVVVYYRLRPVVGERWKNWRGQAEEQARSERMLSRLAPVLFIAYALVLSLMAFDLVQALDPHWFSTLFGGYYFFGSLYAGLAWLAVLGVVLFRAGAAQAVLAPEYLHPLGKLLFGFVMFHGMLFFSQYLPIWYGNLPHEIEFVAVRSYEGSWPAVSWAFILASLLLPFALLLSRKVKRNPRWLLGVSLLVLVGMWLDKFVLVVPSVWHEHQFPFGWLEASVTAGFAALVLLCYWGFSRFFPLLHYEPAQLPTYDH